MIGCCSSRYLYCICFKISMWKFIYKQAYICRQFTEYKFIKYQKHWHSFPCWLIGCSLSVHSQLPWSLFTAELVYYRFSLSHTNKHACANMNLSAQKIYCYACLHLIGFISATNKIMTGSQCYITWICKSQYLWHWLNFESCLITFLFQKISFANCNQHSEFAFWRGCCQKTSFFDASYYLCVLFEPSTPNGNDTNFCLLSWLQGLPLRL